MQGLGALPPAHLAVVAEICIKPVRSLWGEARGRRSNPLPATAAGADPFRRGIALL